VLVGHAGAVEAVAFGPGAALLTAAADHTVRLWDLEAPEPAAVLLAGHRGAVTAAAWWREMPCTAGRDAVCVVWSPVDGRPRYQLDLREASAG
jgi:WD40 repeat protein